MDKIHHFNGQPSYQKILVPVVGRSDEVGAFHILYVKVYV